MLPEASKIIPKSTQNWTKKVSKSLLEAILQKNMKNSILAAIYYTLGMLAHPQNHQNLIILGEKTVTKSIMKAKLVKSHQHVEKCSQKGTSF